LSDEDRQGGKGWQAIGSNLSGDKEEDRMIPPQRRRNRCAAAQESTPTHDGLCSVAGKKMPRTEQRGRGSKMPPRREVHHPRQRRVDPEAQHVVIDYIKTKEVLMHEGHDQVPW
jgi:hypothetical protein